MLAQNYSRGFTDDKLKATPEPKIKYDEGGFYIMTISENVKVYIDDYYRFLGHSYDRCMTELARIDNKLDNLGPQWSETRAYCTAYKIILNLVVKNIRSFYSDSSNFGVFMTPWCFGTVILEKVETFQDRLSKGQVTDDSLPEDTYYVTRYIDEIYRKVLLDLFDFPDEAFKMRWQYSELLKRYSRVLQNITSSLQSVLLSVKSYGV